MCCKPLPPSIYFLEKSVLGITGANMHWELKANSEKNVHHNLLCSELLAIEDLIDHSGGSTPEKNS